jgi:hypothetical protein
MSFDVRFLLQASGRRRSSVDLRLLERAFALAVDARSGASASSIFSFDMAMSSLNGLRGSEHGYRHVDELEEPAARR